MRSFEKLVEKLSFGLNIISMLTTFLMMLLMVTDIALRFLFSSPILGAFEIVELMMVVVVFFSFAQTQVKKGHVSVDVVTNILPLTVRRFFGIITLSLAVVMTAIITYATYLQTVTVMKEKMTTAVLYIKIYPFYLVVLIGMAVFGLTLVVDLIKSIMSLVGGAKSCESC
ncbi:MAG: TRAP transporter small permease [Peptococcaceae bacterium]|nr:TRAP transporter small permease [Peptococcaceae bacterium]MDH7524960.1 TRAP transporter small permease [Peptococcaceae bacterium]